MAAATIITTTTTALVAAVVVTLFAALGSSSSIVLTSESVTASSHGVGSGEGLFTLLYKTHWRHSYLHYNPDGTGWNSIPGALMTCPTDVNATSSKKYPCSSWREITVAGSQITWVTTDGNGQWDNNGGNNYKVANSGIYSLDDGVVKTIKTFPDGCPTSATSHASHRTSSCSGHGKCIEGLCHCTAGWFGFACNRQCKCGKHEECAASGYCQCIAGYGNCTGTGCNSDLNTDARNCGACGDSCYTANVLSATCAEGKCNVTCNPGFNRCSDGTCQKVCGLPGCNTYDLNSCNGNQINTSSFFGPNDWQTVPANASSHHASYQSYDRLKGYAQVVYQNTEHTAAAVTLLYFTKETNTTVECSFGSGKFTSECTAWFSQSNYSGGQLAIAMRGSDGSQLVLDDIDFIWDHPIVNHTSGDYRSGQKGSIVEMFGWRHEDIMNECRFVAKAGYMGVKFFPVQEQLMSSEPFNNVMNPWYFMYQPVSYRLQGRMGSRDQLRKAVNFCRSLGVRTYADAVVNHMTGAGNDANPHHRNGGGGWCTHWGQKNTSADFPPAHSQDRINGSSPFYTQGYTYEPSVQSGLPPMQEFPAVPYGPLDFHCNRPLNSWTSPLDLNAGWLSGLVDLNTERSYVRQRIADYMTDLLGIGFSGFRMDAAKHIRPPDLADIFGRLKKNLGGKFPDDFIVWLEVLTGGEGNMLLCNPDSGYSYSKGLENNLLDNGLDMHEVTKIKIWFDAYPKQPGIDCGQLEMNRKAIQNDDADQQNPGSTSRDMGNQGTVLVIEKDIPLHKHFEKKLFYDPNGASDNDNDYPIRMVLSSYWLPQDAQDYGVPDGNSNCDVCEVDCKTCNPPQSMNFTSGYLKNAVPYSTSGRYTRVHRDIGIINAMRWWMHLGNITAADLED